MKRNRARFYSVVALIVLLTAVNGSPMFNRAWKVAASSQHTKSGAATQTPKSPTVSGVSVLTQHNDNRRTGANLQETILNTSNVNVDQFGKLFTRSVDGYIYAQPLVAAGVSFAQGVTRNVVYVATEHNSVYAFDADDSAAAAPLWQVNFGTPVPSQEIFLGYVDLIPEIGITATPVIDRTSNTLYVVAKTKNLADSTYHQTLHALDLSTGSEKLGAPLEITASVMGSGDPNVGGTVAFNAFQHLNRPGLLLLNDKVYIAFGSHGDSQPYHGWVMGYNAANLQQAPVVYNTTPDGNEGAIWQGGQGLAADAGNNIYLMTGNGTFSGQAEGGRDFGNTIIKLSTAGGLTVTDWFTPRDQMTLSQRPGRPSPTGAVVPDNIFDLDLGAGGPMLLPNTNLLVGVGKDGLLRLINMANMGGYDPNANHNVQEFSITGGLFFGAPVYWNTPTGPQIYVWPTKSSSGDFLKAYRFANGLFQTTPVSQGTSPGVPGYTNVAPLSLSANGSQNGTGIIWASCVFSGNSNGQTVPGILRAFNAADLGKELWNSKQNAARDEIGNFAKFCPPTIANGKVYVATFSGQLHVFGLLPAIAPTSAGFTAQGDQAILNVTASAGTHWTASSSNSWITITSDTSGVGDGQIVYAVRDNLTGSPRKGTLTVAGKTLTVVQAGGAEPDCTYSISPQFTSFAASGGFGSINVMAEERCSWQATANANWITITSNCCDIGNNQVTYTVAANPGTTGRSGTITVGGVTFNVKQKGM